MSKFDLEKQLKPYSLKLPFNKTVLAVSNPPVHVLWRCCNDRAVKVSRVTLPVTDGEIAVDLFSDKANGWGNRILFYCHGGGFGLDASPQHKKIAFEFAKNGYLVVLPHYRLIPKYRYPTARNDVFAAYKWMCGTLDLTDCKVVIGGDSAGGCLTTQLVKDVTDGGLLAPSGQMLLYPVIDSSCSTESMKKYPDSPLWDGKNNVVMWQLLLDGVEDVSEASPLTATLPSVVPPTYMEVAEVDCLHDEGVAYCNRLQQVGTEVELHQVDRAFHGYDIAYDSDVVKRCRKTRLEFCNKVTSSDKKQ